ncbi:aspartate kinase [Bacillus ectoiniformans]|uniref:aspartate kinase n=1 Tax=Bacillus ectoiniformans TaxID=1494429 RepID=UPI00195B5E19|nr:aspartate kinase [Bacillus ectoiniformans]MBM7648896.1 aspartate kinase [Bacillus ectoiniformans]
MALIVQKFGGTSVGSVERIQNVASRVQEEKSQGNDVVVVVSAMGKTTDQLVGLAKALSESPSKREMDMLLATGEQVTIALLSMALQQQGYEAISLTGWQAGIHTEKVPGNARITHIDTNKTEQLLNEGKVVIVAGFQGKTEDGEITTLGRGGSDTTAVALAAALKAERCDIYTDVTGVYTSDPRYIEGARKLDAVSYDEMLELANLGAGVLHPRAVEFAKNYSIPLVVRSSMEKEEGTRIEEEISMEQNLVVRGVAFEEEVARITIEGLKNEIQSLSAVFAPLAKNNINVDIIIQSRTANKYDLSFSTKESDLEAALDVVTGLKRELKYEALDYETGLSKVSIVGSGMISNPGVAAQMFEVLAEQEVAIHMVSTSEIKVSAVIAQEETNKAAQSLHDAFQLNLVPAMA